MKTEEIMKYVMYAAGAYALWILVIQPMMNKSTTATQANLSPGALLTMANTAATANVTGVGAIATPLRKMPARRSMSFGGSGVGAIVNGLNPVGSETIQ